MVKSVGHSVCTFNAGDDRLVTVGDVEQLILN